MQPKRTKKRTRLVLVVLGLAVAGVVAVQLPEVIRYVKMERM